MIGFEGQEPARLAESETAARNAPPCAMWPA